MDAKIVIVTNGTLLKRLKQYEIIMATNRMEDKQMECFEND